jgi:polysaccharide export outer membrane protein
MKKRHLLTGLALCVWLAGAGTSDAQSGGSSARPANAGAPATPAPPPATAAPTQPVPTTPGFVIGPEDVLTVFFWREKEMSGDVVVRPDGRISLPLLNDIEAAGLTPEQLRDKLTEQAQRFVQDPNVTVVVKQINSRRVFVTGMVGKQGSYQLTAPTTVLQMLSMAGGLQEFAKQDKIVIMRNESGRTVRYPFNFKDVLEGRNLRQNIELKPGDTVIVP